MHPDDIATHRIFVPGHTVFAYLIVWPVNVKLQRLLSLVDKHASSLFLVVGSFRIMPEYLIWKLLGPEGCPPDRRTPLY